MRKTVRAHSSVDACARFGRVVAQLPPSAQQALVTVAERRDLPLVAGAWNRDNGGCLVANVVAALAGDRRADHQTLDLRVLELIPELGSRDLNRLIVAWDDAALQEGCTRDAGLRRLLRDALDRAGVPSQSLPGDVPSTTSMVSSSAPRTTVSVTSSPGE